MGGYGAIALLFYAGLGLGDPFECHRHAMSIRMQEARLIDHKGNMPFPKQQIPPLSRAV